MGRREKRGRTNKRWDSTGGERAGHKMEKEMRGEGGTIVKGEDI